MKYRIFFMVQESIKRFPILLRKSLKVIAEGDFLVLGIVSSLIFTGAIASFAQEQAAELEAQWLWGEIDSVDIQRNEVTVRFLDYDTEQEKEVNISVDEKTTYENANSLLDIKPSDVVSINYLVFPDGKNLARNISVEKPETTSPETGGQ